MSLTTSLEDRFIAEWAQIRRADTEAMMRVADKLLALSHRKPEESLIEESRVLISKHYGLEGKIRQ